MTLALILAQCAVLAQREADAILQPYAWPPLPPLTDEEVVAADRLEEISMEMADRAWRLGQEDQGTDALFERYVEQYCPYP